MKTPFIFLLISYCVASLASVFSGANWRVRLPSGAVKTVHLPRGRPPTLVNLAKQLRDMGILGDADEVVSDSLGVLDLNLDRPVPSDPLSTLVIRRRGTAEASAGPRRRVPRMSPLVRRQETTKPSIAIKKLWIDPSLAPLSARAARSGSAYAVLGTREVVNGSVEVSARIAVELLRDRTYGQEDVSSSYIDTNIARIADLTRLLNVSVLGCLVGDRGFDPVSAVDAVLSLKLGEMCGSDDLMIVSAAPSADGPNAGDARRKIRKLNAKSEERAPSVGLHQPAGVALTAFTVPPELRSQYRNRSIELKWDATGACAEEESTSYSGSSTVVTSTPHSWIELTHNKKGSTVLSLNATLQRLPVLPMPAERCVASFSHAFPSMLEIESDQKLRSLLERNLAKSLRKLKTVEEVSLWLRDPHLLLYLRQFVPRSSMEVLCRFVRSTGSEGMRFAAVRMEIDALDALLASRID